MSRLASKPVIFEAGVTIKVEGARVMVKGPKGELSVPIPEGIEVKVEGSNVHVSRRDDSCKALQGLTWSLVRNAVVGVTKQFSRKIEIVGKGWRSTVKGKVINLQVGHSHPVDFELPSIRPGQKERLSAAALVMFRRHLHKRLPHRSLLTKI